MQLTGGAYTDEIIVLLTFEQSKALSVLMHNTILIIMGGFDLRLRRRLVMEVCSINLFFSN